MEDQTLLLDTAIGDMELETSLKAMEMKPTDTTIKELDMGTACREREIMRGGSRTDCKEDGIQVLELEMRYQAMKIMDTELEIELMELKILLMEEITDYMGSTIGQKEGETLCTVKGIQFKVSVIQ